MLPLSLFSLGVLAANETLAPSRVLAGRAPETPLLPSSPVVVATGVVSHGLELALVEGQLISYITFHHCDSSTWLRHGGGVPGSPTVLVYLVRCSIAGYELKETVYLAGLPFGFARQFSSVRALNFLCSQCVFIMTIFMH